MLLLCLWGDASRAAAQHGDAERTAAARALFEEGLSLLDREEWAPAADRFERALALRPSAQVAYNLSTALIAQRRLVRASEVLLIAARDASAPAEVRDAAARRREEVLGRIARLTIRVSGAREGVTVEIDARPLDWAMIGIPIPVDPGSHEIAAVRAGETLARESIALREGGDGAVSLELPTAAPLPPVEAAPADATPALSAAPAPDDEGGGTSVFLWAGLGVLAAGAAVVAIVLLTSSDPDPVQGSAGVVAVEF